ncbi:MAG TPA: primary-amine oxidase [Acidimicrobiales bacterium]|jgi:primary-amine oxidase|nr:primary-amine oxidase [Acidimicrobiales bacterium]
MPSTPAPPAAPPVLHPLAPLSGDEITAAREIVFASGRAEVPNEVLRFAYVGLCDPPKELVRAFDRGELVQVDRCVRIVLLQGPVDDVTEVIVSVTRREVDRWEIVRDVRPPLQMEESILVLAALHEHPEWNAALDRRGIVDRSLVQIDPWPAGTFGLAHEEGRRITRCLAYLRESPDDNGYARPLEGLLAFVDMGRGEVLEVVDLGVVPLPPKSGSYYPEDNGPLRTDLKPLEITQPEGPSFEIDGNLVRWQNWSLRVGMDPLEGLVIYTVGYEDGGRVRPVLFRASVSEMVVPYGHPGPMHAWKSAFDAGEWGLGRMANSLTLGCDCLGEIRYFDDVFADERGKPRTRPNAICMHEEDYGILWKHNDMVSGRTEVRRSRRLVVSSIATVGNYEYGFYWYFYLDGTMQLEVKLTGIMSTMAVANGDAGDHAKMVAPGLAAPYHQHLFNVRLDIEVDGSDNSVFEVDASGAGPPGTPENPWGNVFGTTATLLDSELAARRDVDPSRSRSWRIANRSMRNGVGEPTSYKLLPASTPTLLAHPDSTVGQRAAFASHNLWVTPFDPEERRAAGDYPNQHRGGAGLPEWTARDRPIVDTDIVLWHSFGVTHIPRPEDWPVMPVEYTGFSLVPFGFFDRNPALDVPPSADHCHD